LLRTAPTSSRALPPGAPPPRRSWRASSTRRAARLTVASISRHCS